MTHPKWQASFTITTKPTQNAPNDCSDPNIYLNELHFNGMGLEEIIKFFLYNANAIVENYIELSVDSFELPLDQATVAIVIDSGKAPAIYSAYSLQGQNALDTLYFTVGNNSKADMHVNILLPVSFVFCNVCKAFF